MTATLGRSMSSLVATGVAFVTENRTKLVKYCGVAAIGVPAGLLILWILLRTTTWNEGLANAVGSLIMIPPNYLMNRYWVWEKNDSNRFMGEVVPFGVMAVIGLLVSTGAVALAASLGAPDILLLLVNLVSFGIVWVAKFFVLDKVLFGRTSG